jgi:uncharacterized iron-regulated protein
MEYPDVRWLFLVVSWLIASAASAGACSYPKGAFLKTLDGWAAACGHPLCGKLYAPDQSRIRKNPPPCDADTWLTLKDELKETVAQGGLVLAGDMHDNPKHHELRSLLGFGNYPAIVFEQLSRDQTPALDAFAASIAGKVNEKSLDEFKAALDWEKSGWAKYAYDPLLRAALLAQHPIFAGDAPPALIKKIASEGADAIPADMNTKSKLDVALGDKADAASTAEIEQAHCGMIPKTAIPNMALAQRYRDASLADAAVDAMAKHHSALLLAGNTHVRTDRGVPWYVRARMPGKKILSIMLIEVEDGKTEPEAYVPKDPDGKPAIDYIIFTPRAERGDVCDGMKKKAG